VPQPGFERFALEVLKYQEVHAILMAYVVQSTNIGMGEVRNGACFLLKSLAQFRGGQF
jgi:hypothetical protein